MAARRGQGTGGRRQELWIVPVAARVLEDAVVTAEWGGRGAGCRAHAGWLRRAVSSLAGWVAAWIVDGGG